MISGVLNSINRLKEEVANNTLPAFIAEPMVRELVQRVKNAQAAQQGAPTSTVVDKIDQEVQALFSPQGIQQVAPQMAAPQQPMPQQIPQQPMPQRMAQQPPVQPAGIDAAQSNLPTQGMAGGGIVAFAGEDGSLVDDDYDPDEDEVNEEYYADMAAKDRMAQMIANQEYESDALTQAILEQGGSNSGEGITYREPLPSGASKGIKDNSFTGKIEHLESRGRDYDEKGNILTSSKGARGRMQVMPGTSRDPGFGVTPARNESPEELARVGRDYANALKDYYKGDERTAAMAYNWGPGRVNEWIAGGRKGPVPGETRQYASNFAEGGIVNLAAGGKVPGFYDGVFITDPEGVTRTPADQLLDEEYGPRSNKKGIDKLLDKEYGPQKAPPKGAPPTWFERLYSSSGIPGAVSNVVRSAGSSLGYGAPVIAGGAGATYGASGTMASPLQTSNREALEDNPMLGALGGDTSLFSAIYDQGLKNEEKKAAAAPTKSSAPEKNKPWTEEQLRMAENRFRENKRDLFPAAPPKDNEGNEVIKEEKKLSPFQEAMNKFMSGQDKRAAKLEQQETLGNYMAALQGFLGMMGGTSPYALTNIGQGGSSGIAALMNMQKYHGANERAYNRDQLGMLQMGKALEKDEADRVIRNRALANQENKTGIEERIKSANAFETARKDMMKEFGFNLIQYNNLKQKDMSGKLDDKERETYNSLKSMYEDIDRRARNQVYGSSAMPGFRIVGVR